MRRGLLPVLIILVAGVTSVVVVRMRSPVPPVTSASIAPPAIPADAYRATLRCLRSAGGDAVTVFASGEAVRAELTITNASGGVRNDPNTVLAWRLEVVRSDGTLVMAEAPPAAAPVATIAIQPGMPYASQRYWTQADGQGRPVPPGGYILRAVSVAGVSEAPINVLPLVTVPPRN